MTRFSLLILITSLLSACAATGSKSPQTATRRRPAASTVSEELANLFARGTVPTSEDARIRWACFLDAEGNNVLQEGTDYGFGINATRITVATFGFSNQPHELIEQNGALMASDFGTDSANYLALRVVNRRSGRRLIIEESSNLPAWQTETKSAVTGFTPNLYLICVPRELLKNFVLGYAVKTGPQLC